MIEIQDDGLLPVRIGDVEHTLDAYDVHHRLLEIRAQVDDELPDAAPIAIARAFNARVSAYLADLGFGPVSHRAADRFASAVFDAVDRLGKEEAGAAGPTPASPTTSAPTP